MRPSTAGPDPHPLIQGPAEQDFSTLGMSQPQVAVCEVADARTRPHSQGGCEGPHSPDCGAVYRVPFGRLVDDMMDQEPYRSVRRVFWIVDNGSSHRGDRAAQQLQARHPRIVVQSSILRSLKSSV